MSGKGFAVVFVLALLAALLLFSSSALAAVAPPSYSGCSWTGDYYSCGSGSSSYTCSNGVSSATGKCDDACGSSLSCDGLSPGQFYGCNMVTRQQQVCDASCQITNGVCNYVNCAAHANCDGKSPGSYVAGNLCSSGRHYLCSGKCWQELGSKCSSSCAGTSASCDGFAPGKTFCQIGTGKQQTCNAACGLDTATACAKNVCGAVCVSGETTTIGCPAGQQKSCDTNSCKWGRCTATKPPCTDTDGDSYYSNAVACGKTAAKQDCNDANAAVNPGAAEVCGNGVDEDCDGTDKVCAPVPVKTCGNGVVDAGEDCDGSGLNGQTCVSKGFGGGVLSCYAAGTAGQCKYDVSGCVAASFPSVIPAPAGCSPVSACENEGSSFVYCNAQGQRVANCGLCGGCLGGQVCTAGGTCRATGLCEGVDPDRKKECCSGFGMVWGRSGEAAAEPASASKDVFYAWVESGVLKTAVSDLKLNGWGASVVAGSGAGLFGRVKAVRQLVAGDVVHLAWVQDSDSGIVDFDGEPVPAYEVWAQSFSRDGKALGAVKKLAGGGTVFRGSPQIFDDGGSVVHSWLEGGKVVGGSGFGIGQAGLGTSAGAFYGGEAYYAWVERDFSGNVRRLVRGVGPVGGSLAVSELGKGSFFELPGRSYWSGGVPSVQVADGRVYYAWPVRYVDFNPAHFGTFYGVRLASSDLDGSGLKVGNVGLGIRSSAGFARVLFKVSGGRVYFALEPNYAGFGKAVYVWVGAADSVSLKKVEGFSPFFARLSDYYVSGSNVVSVDAYGGMVYLWYVSGGVLGLRANLIVLDGFSGSLADKAVRSIGAGQLQLQVAPDSSGEGGSAAVDTQFSDALGDRKAGRGVRLLPGEELCVGDDVSELFSGRRREGIAASAGDVAVCDKFSDCVFGGRCFSDADTVASTFFGGSKAAVWASSWRGEVSADVNGDGRLEVCDPGRWVSPEGSVSGVVSDAATGLGIGSAAVAAVGTSNPALQYSATTGGDGAYAISGVEPASYDFTASKAGYASSTWNNVPVLPFQVTTVSFQLLVSSATVSGFVRNVSRENSEGPCPVQGCPVGGAVVKVLGSGLSAVSAADGSYLIADVPVGAYDITASRSVDGYEDAFVFGREVVGGVVSADFVLVKALGQCEDDCTKVGSNLCDAGCHGKGLCWFNSDETKQACDSTFGLVEVLGGGRYVDCCGGGSYTPLKADISVPSKNVVVTKKPVLYKGKLVNMVMVVFNR